jgi:hypothetical protein
MARKKPMTLITKAKKRKTAPEKPRSASVKLERSERASMRARKGAKARVGRREVKLTRLSGTDRVARAIDLLNTATSYPQGCSGFVCDVLQIDYEQAKDIMAGSDVDANSVGTYPNYDFRNINPGDVCGWLAADATGDIQTDHVTIYIGNPNQLFIDVKGVNQAPRAVKLGYGRRQKVWKSQNV